MTRFHALAIFLAAAICGGIAIWGLSVDSGIAYFAARHPDVPLWLAYAAAILGGLGALALENVKSRG